MTKFLPFVIFLIGCPPHGGSSADASPADASPADASPPPMSTLTIKNDTSADDTVYVAFGADSAVRSWTGCSAPSCSFPLAAKSSLKIPLAGYLNATISFNAAVTCGVTKAELNVNNPAWYDVVDVSLVDGYSNKVSITIDGKKLGPPKGLGGNEKVFGLFPLGCDICVARQSPPCGMKPGVAGCKVGSQLLADAAVSAPRKSPRWRIKCGRHARAVIRRA